MFKKWFWISGISVVLVACVWSVALSYAFNRDDSLDTPTGADASAVQAASLPTVTFADLTYAVTVKGLSVDPEAFLQDTPANAEVTVAYSTAVDFEKPGKYEIPIEVQLHERTETTSVTLYILDPARIVEKEAGIPSDMVMPEDFIANYSILNDDAKADIQFVTDIAALDLSKVRRYEVALTVNGAPVKSMMDMIDTVPPSGDSLDVTLNTGSEVSPEDFINDIFDISPVTVRFANDEAPDVFVAGERPVYVVLEDSSGNLATIEATLTVLPNTTPPVFKGLRNIEVLLGDSVMYKKNVAAEDSFGNPLEFTVNSDEVDTYTPGTYTVSYSAEDVNGNKTVETIELLVVAITEEMVNEKIVTLYDKIINDEMTDREKAKQIYDWVSTNVGYVSSAPKDSVYEGAYQAIQSRSGDCFTFYALSEVLLTMAGIDNMRVTRIDGKSDHYWNLVYVEDGWYHFDATPSTMRGVSRFLMTDSQAEDFAQRVYNQNRTINYYTYDKALYPEVMP